MSNPIDEIVLSSRHAAKKAQAFIKIFRDLDPDMQAQQIYTFLHIMSKPNISFKELEQETGLASSTISRHVGLLGDKGRGNKPGLKIVIAYEDPEDRRINRVRPTAAGQKVAQKLTALLENDHGGS